MHRLPVRPGPAARLGVRGADRTRETCRPPAAGSRPRSAGRRPRGHRTPAARGDPTSDANMATVPAASPLPTLLSQALVAHTIELDNEAEHRLPHRTTRTGLRRCAAAGPWLVSFVVVGQRVCSTSRTTRSAWAPDHGSRCPSAPNTARARRLGDTPRRPAPSDRRVAGANAMCAGWLERHGCAVTEPDRTASRGKVLRLTPKGQKAQQKYHGSSATPRRVADEVRCRHHRRAQGRARARRRRRDFRLLAPRAGPRCPTPTHWRARTRRRPETLPHHPMVLHRGGYPDGS